MPIRYVLGALALLSFAGCGSNVRAGPDWFSDEGLRSDFQFGFVKGTLDSKTAIESGHILLEISQATCARDEHCQSDPIAFIVPQYDRRTFQETQAPAPEVGAEIVLLSVESTVFTDDQSVEDCVLAEVEASSCPTDMSLESCAERGCLVLNHTLRNRANLLVKQGESFCTPWFERSGGERCWPEEQVDRVIADWLRTGLPTEY